MQSSSMFIGNCTYYSHKVRKITNLFKQTDINIAFRSTNTFLQQTRTRTHDTSSDHNKSGIYKLQCRTCNKSYIGQTNRNLSVRYSERIRYIKKQRPPVSIRPTHTTKHPRIRHPHRHNVTTETYTQPTKLIPYEQLYTVSEKDCTLFLFFF